MNAKGFTLLELVVATALLIIVCGAVALMSSTLRERFERSLGAADLTGGSRAVLERIAGDIREAGSGASVGAQTIRLADRIATVVALADLDAAGPGAPSRAIRLTRVPLLAPQGVLRADAAAGTVIVELDTTVQCYRVGVSCGFRAGTDAVLHDDSRLSTVSVQSVVAPGTVRLSAPLAAPYAAGSVLAAVSVVSYGLRPEADGSFRLVRATPQSEQPMLQHVVDFAVMARGTSALRVRQVDITLRVEAPSAALRGPSAVLFRRPGSSRQTASWVPDVERRVTVITRNLEG